MPAIAWRHLSLHAETVTLPPGAEALDMGECFERLADHVFGRVVYTLGALPAITPVRYAVVGQEVFFRLEPEIELARAVSGAVIAFEVDEIDEEEGSGWAVVVTGIALPCAAPSDWPHIAATGLLADETDFDNIFTVAPGLVTGREFTG